jgi:polyhydroxyalkanoate synthesis repressor PhaR
VADTRIIKKYPNRRLYDTEISRYITLSDIRELVMGNENFQVVDAHSNEDITRSILLQIILEQESEGTPLFSTEVLGHMIRFYEDALQGMFTSYLEKSLGMFAEQQAHFQQQLHSPLTGNPIDAMTELTQRNLEIWKDLQDHFFQMTGPSGGNPDKS